LLQKIFTIKNFVRFLLGGIALIAIVFGWTAFEVCQQSQVTSGESADAAIVLGAAIYNDAPSPVFQERINHAINLYESGRVKFLIFTGGFGAGEKWSEAAVGRNYAIGKGVPAERIFIEEESRTTFQNLYFAREIMRRDELKSALIVSDPLHIKRATTMARDLEIENAFPSPTPTSRIISFNKKLEFLFQETRLLLAYSLHRLFSRDFVAGELSVGRS
jgi:uncharacterized SAM-binding protein YcdF (DUF218 family)